MFDIGLGGAFLGGLISFISPCVLPIVPPYLCYLAGVSIDHFTGTGDPGSGGRRIFLTALVFVLGFTTVFVALGASASAVGQLVQQYMDWLAIAAGAAILVMGLHFLGVFRIALLYREARVQVERKPPGLVGAFVMGLAFAFGWTPCAGPVLAAILFSAGAQESVGEGARLLTAYSLGIGLPFLAAAAFARPFMLFMARFRKHLGTVEKIMGVMLVLTGILFMTGGMATIAYWILEYVPALGQVG
ncbi:MAG: cytochrome c biogenesis protein CcdA [Pseudomonadota bacterium]|nr:cytochrome c biogenesis protein CcdA [Pseudomonadota bacterium]